MIEDEEIHCFTYETLQDAEIQITKKNEGEAAEFCDWTGNLKDAKRHHDQCPFARMDCPHIGCNDVFFRKSLQEHIDNCLYRLVSCKLCNQRKKFDLMVAHLLECPERPLPCPNGCLDSNGEVAIFSPRSILHHRKICAMEVIDCKFVGVGCQMKMSRIDIVLHENDANAHIGCLLTKIKELENYIQCLVLKIPISQLVDVRQSRTITVSGHSFHFKLYPNSDHIGWHSFFLHLEKDDDWVGLVDVTAIIESVSYSDLHPVRQKTLDHIYQRGDNRGYKDYMETIVLGGDGYVKDEQITLRVKITINS
jgi:hypothetical protein